MTVRTIEPLRVDELDGQLGGASRTLAATINEMRAASVSETTDALHLYVNGDTGSDENSGRSADKPKETLQAVFDLIPTVVHHDVAVHCRGTISVDGSNILSKFIPDSPFPGQIIVDGGPGVNIVDGPRTSTGSSVSSLSDSGAGWTPDEHAGKWVQILTGAAAGQTRMIWKHDATTITPGRDWSADPGTGISFQIVEPSTVIQGGTVAGALWLQCSGNGVVRLQRLVFADGSAPLDVIPRGDVWAAGCIFDTSDDVAVLRGGTCILWDVFYDPETFGIALTERIGCVFKRGGFTGTATWDLLRLNGAYFSSTAPLQIRSANNWDIKGCRVRGGTTLINCRRGGQPGLTNGLDVEAGLRLSEFSYASGSGVTVKDSDLYVAAGIDFSDSGSHGLEAENSVVQLDGAVVGSGNTGAGVRAHTRSTVTIKNGAAPTVTGTVGNFSIDGTTEASTWAVIDAGTPAQDTVEQTVAKEI
jgi:hypothetical protein